MALRGGSTAPAPWAGMAQTGLSGRTGAPDTGPPPYASPRSKSRPRACSVAVTSGRAHRGERASEKARRSVRAQEPARRSASGHVRASTGLGAVPRTRGGAAALGRDSGAAPRVFTCGDGLGAEDAVEYRAVEGGPCTPSIATAAARRCRWPRCAASGSSRPTGRSSSGARHLRSKRARPGSRNVYSLPAELL